MTLLKNCMAKFHELDLEKLSRLEQKLWDLEALGSRSLDLEKLSRLEQDMACGEDVDGNAPRGLVNALIPLLADTSRSPEDKMRLLMIYIITQVMGEGIKESDRDKLFKSAGLTLADQVG
eukprot:tig00021438_g21452.t1